MVLVLVSPLLRHSLLTLPLEAKLTLVTISPTIVTMELHDLRLGLGMGLLTWFLSEGPKRRTREGGCEWEPIKILLEGDEYSNKTNTASNTCL
jgi:hypothetical protein